ncbi:MAG TPA: transcription antitermination factor NusB [Acidobacteriaceae bacterium]
MIAPARQVAFRILRQITTTDAHSDDLLRAPEVDALSAQDRALTTTLVLGTLRWQLALDEQIRPLLARPGAQLKPEVATALRMGAYQLQHLDRVPPHAVLHDSVELVKQGRERSAAGMVNAVLRKIAASGRVAAPAQLATAQEIAAAFAHPAWMVERWAARYGIPAAEAICRWDQEPAGVTLRLDASADAEPEMHLEPGAFLTNARRVLDGDPSRSETAGAGRARIQDEASQLVAELAAAATPAARNVLDTCAAPGGKTAILTDRLPQAHITAVDASRERLAAMRKRFEPPGSRKADSAPVPERLRWQVADAARLQLQHEHDLILCDVPCSGTGTMARNPEIRMRVTAFDLQRQQERQAAILGAALAGLAPGGVLVYSTCSLEPEENETVIETVINNDEGFALQPVRPLLDQLTERDVVTAGGRELLDSAVKGLFLRTIPGIHPCDGFFAAIIARV